MASKSQFCKNVIGVPFLSCLQDAAHFSVLFMLRPVERELESFLFFEHDHIPGVSGEVSSATVIVYAESIFNSQGAFRHG